MPSVCENGRVQRAAEIEVANLVNVFPFSSMTKSWKFGAVKS